MAGIQAGIRTATAFQEGFSAANAAVSLRDASITSQAESMWHGAVPIIWQTRMPVR